MDWSLWRSRISGVFMVFSDYPWVTLVVAVIFLIFSIFKMISRQSSGGMWLVVLVSSGLFLFALSKITGFGFGFF